MIDERRAEKKEGSDLMNILLETEFYQKNDDGLLIDEIITFFLAGMKTSQTTTTNLIYQLIKNPEVKSKLLNEISFTSPEELTFDKI